MTRKPYRITLSGCDDPTAVELALTDEQADAYRYLAELVAEEAAGDMCKPTLAVQDIA